MENEGIPNTLICEHLGISYADLQINSAYGKLVINTKMGLNTFIVDAYMNEKKHMFISPPIKK